jgi:Lipase (class 3)
MANMAERLWEAAGATVLQLLRKYADYEFVITGHSLGAGTACLLNVMCHANGGSLVDGRRARCFAYAAPPVFAPLELVPAAVQSCTNFIHERDVVPFLSIDSVRHLFASVGTIEKHTQQMNWLSRMRLVSGYQRPDQALLQDVQRASTTRLTPKIGAPVLAIPAASTLWMREKENSGKYDMKNCDPVKLARLGIRIDPNMLQDHFPPRYEHALHNLDDESAD